MPLSDEEKWKICDNPAMVASDGRSYNGVVDWEESMRRPTLTQYNVQFGNDRVSVAPDNLKLWR